jgi:hypothetical protein
VFSRDKICLDGSVDRLRSEKGIGGVGLENVLMGDVPRHLGNDVMHRDQIPMQMVGSTMYGHRRESRDHRCLYLVAVGVDDHIVDTAGSEQRFDDPVEQRLACDSPQVLSWHPLTVALHRDHAGKTHRPSSG